MSRLIHWLPSCLAILAFSLVAVVTADDTTTTETVVDPSSAEVERAAPQEEPYTPKSKSELRRTLSPIQYDVTQNEATEPAFRNRHWNNNKAGTYECVVCGRELFSSKTKFKSGTGWPSFYAPIDEKHVGYRDDWRLIYTRTEVHCARCEAHLGHVFDDGPRPTGKRYCMNSAALKFVEQKEDE